MLIYQSIIKLANNAADISSRNERRQKVKAVTSNPNSDCMQL